MPKSGCHPCVCHARVHVQAAPGGELSLLGLDVMVKDQTDMEDGIAQQVGNAQWWRTAALMRPMSRWWW